MTESLKYLEYFTDESPRELAPLGDCHYSVYVHVSPEEAGSLPYVGMTGWVPTKRRWKGGSGYKSQTKFFNAIKKYGWQNFKHYVVATHLTEEEALLIESMLVEELDSFRNGYNLTVTGDGRYKSEGRFNTDPETATSDCVPVDCYTMDFELVGSWRSVAAAATAMGVCVSTIYKCVHDEGISAGGYRWVKHGTDPRIGKIDHEFVCTSVVQWTKNGELVAHYASIKDAATATGIHRSDISSCLCNDSRRTAGGYIWTRQGEDFHVRETRYPCKPVAQFDLQGNYIATHPSVTEAATVVGITYRTVGAAIAGKTRTAGGYQFRYDDGIRQIAPVRPSKCAKPIVCLNDGKHFERMDDAVKHYGISIKSIRRALNDNHVLQSGLRFQYLDDYNTQH